MASPPAQRRSAPVLAQTAAGRPAIRAAEAILFRRLPSSWPATAATAAAFAAASPGARPNPSPPAMSGTGVLLAPQPAAREYLAASAARKGDFSRPSGPGGFTYYCHGQQQAKQIVPDMNHASRLDHCNLAYDEAARWDDRRLAMLSQLSTADTNRMEKLRRTKAMIQRPLLAREVSKSFRASRSLPELRQPCGEDTAALRLLNRRVDVNNLRHCRRQMAEDQRRQAELELQRRSRPPQLTTLVQDIDEFEALHVAAPRIIPRTDWPSGLHIDTVTDWGKATTTSFAAGRTDVDQTGVTVDLAPQ